MAGGSAHQGGGGGGDDRADSGTVSGSPVTSSGQEARGRGGAPRGVI
jgi:hypothetical protein